MAAAEAVDSEFPARFKDIKTTVGNHHARRLRKIHKTMAVGESPDRDTQFQRIEELMKIYLWVRFKSRRWPAVRELNTAVVADCCCLSVSPAFRRIYWLDEQ